MHFQSVHEIHVNSGNLEFSIKKEFFKIKEGMEYVTLTKLIKNRGTKLVDDSSTSYFNCHLQVRLFRKLKV